MWQSLVAYMHGLPPFVQAFLVLVLIIMIPSLVVVGFLFYAATRPVRREEMKQAEGRVIPITVQPEAITPVFVRHGSDSRGPTDRPYDDVAVPQNE